jgi:hypothetical protein
MGTLAIHIEFAGGFIMFKEYKEFTTVMVVPSIMELTIIIRVMVEYILIHMVVTFQKYCDFHLAIIGRDSIMKLQCFGT